MSVAWEFVVREENDEIMEVSMREIKQPLDYAPILEERERFRHNLQQIAFWCCIAFIAVGGLLTWLSWR